MNKLGFALVLVCGTLGSCDKKSGTTPVSAKPIPATFFLASAPVDAGAVEAVKGSAKVGDVVTVRGRIGGGDQPFVPGRGMFTLVGEGLPACSDNADDKCATPWDYCCESGADIAAHSVTVQVVDAAGSPLLADVKGQGGVKELSEVIVIGKVAQADGAIFVINATAAFVVKP